MFATFARKPRPTASALLDELRRQYDILRDESLLRLVAGALAFALALVFLPWPIIAACALVKLLAEIGCLALLRDLDPARRPDRYWLCLATVFIIETAFVIPPALIWHLDGPYTKAFAVGMTAATMMHLMTVRAIHLPMGITGLAAIGLTGLGSNSLLWLKTGDYPALAMTTLCALGALGYCLGAMINNNHLHRDTAAGRDAAQAANAAKGRFLAQMSHELRTPLNAILGMGHAELRRVTDPISRDRLSVLIEAAEGLSTILDDILDMSAVQEGRLPIRAQPSPPRAEIAATVALFHPSIEDAGLGLQLDIAPDLPDLALFDPKRLRQCLSNLMSNAIKNTPAGSIRIRAQMLPDSAATPMLRIEVADTGPGIPPEQRSAIFEPFVRGRSKPPAFGGRGLGLSISRSLARQMGGDLTLAPPGADGLARPGEADWDSGACFVLTVALPPVPAGSNQPAVPASAATPDLLAGRSILAVDDIGTNRLVAVCYLQMLGATAIEAPGGAEAIARLVQEPVDLVLLDMNMPGMDGLETFARIRALPGPAGQVPVVALTADAMDEQRRAYLAQGLDGYLAKPLNPERLAAELGRLLPPATATPGQAHSSGGDPDRTVAMSGSRGLASDAPQAVSAPAPATILSSRKRAKP
ncbi:MAG TPA: ATP-binding protein [Paracoccaceae bacterium]